MKEDQRFLTNIDNPDKYWIIELAGGKVVHIRVINYVKTTKGEPITLYVQNKSGMSYEIVWNAIQTIRPLNKDGKGVY